MSYHVLLEKEMMDVKTGETEFKAVESFNHTSNLCQFFRYFFDGDLGLFELNGLYGDEVKLAIDKFYDNLKENKLFWEKCKLYNTPNGWGNIRSALMFLDGIREVARKNPSVVCFVSC
tara:strand:+ start:304 stop:657 length:354 start_codon:yes stop_codon:yes gene_type:complete